MTTVPTEINAAAVKNSATDKHTPMMQQYHRLKGEAGDALLFYRMGDFFELFFEDARIAAACLDIALTARGEHGGERVPMCGVPAHAAEGYLARLIKAAKADAVARRGFATVVSNVGQTVFLRPLPLAA